MVSTGIASDRVQNGCVVRLPQRSVQWLAALASAAGQDGWATAAEVAEALHRTASGTSAATSSAAAANLRSLRVAGLVESRPWNFRREWKLTRTGWAFVVSD
jgi:hypothetical protein